MAITRAQILDLGFQPAKRQKGLGSKKYDTLIYKINNTDYLYLGYHSFRGNIDFKTLWKSFEDDNGERISYPVEKLGLITLTNLKEYIEACNRTSELKDKLKQELLEDNGSNN